MVHRKDIQLNIYKKSTHYYCVSYHDNGLGFDQNYADKIFQLFQRIAHTAKKRPLLLGAAHCYSSKIDFAGVYSRHEACLLYHRGLCDGLNNWMDEKGLQTLNDFIGKSVFALTRWEDLDITYHHRKSMAFKYKPVFT